METEQLAKRVINDSLKITKDDSVKVYCNRHTIDLAENLALECQRIGAHVDVALYTDKIQYDFLLERPIEYLETPNPFDLAVLDTANLSIDLSRTQDPSKYQGLTPERWNAIRRGSKTYIDKLHKTKHQGAIIQLALVTPVRAKAYGIDYEAWRNNAYAAVDVDYREMQETGTQFRTMLENADEIHIANEAGTDLTARMDPKTIRLDAGVLDREGSGKASISVELPGGSLSVIPTISSVQGTFVSDTILPHSGKLVEGITWVFENGSIVSFEGGENISLVKEPWLKATGAKDRFGFFQFGLNPIMEQGFMFDSIIRGAVMVGIGDNRWVGGSNESTMTSTATSIAATVKLDSKTIIDNGKLVL